jgi:hypothetical protein
VSFLALLVEVAPTVPDLTPFTGLGVGGVLAGIMFYFYRQDRRHSEDRFEELGKDFRAIVEANTAAMVSLRDSLNGKR